MRRLRIAITWGYVVLVVGTATVAVASGRRPYAPLSVLPEPDPVTLDVVFGTGQEAWLREAAAAFEASGSRVRGVPIDVVLQPQGSRDALQRLVDGSLQPDVWVPASNLWIALLNQEWQQRTGRPLVATSGADAPRPLARTALVVAMWADRAAALRANGPALWEQLHAAATAPEGWGAYGHPEWGIFKWGHAAPRGSNSGLQTVLLMAYAFHKKQSGLTAADIGNPEFQTWLRQVEGAATFGDSSATLMNDMVAFGPSRYDAIATYENLALEYLPHAARRWQPLVLLYPPANIWSDHPYAILDAPWVERDTRAAARQFRDFLLSQGQQQRALQLGLRPVREDVPLDGAGSPFVRDAEGGVQRDVATVVEAPPADVVAALIDVWARATGR